MLIFTTYSRVGVSGLLPLLYSRHLLKPDYLPSTFSILSCTRNIYIYIWIHSHLFIELNSHGNLAVHDTLLSWWNKISKLSAIISIVSCHFAFYVLRRCISQFWTITPSDWRNSSLRRFRTINSLKLHESSIFLLGVDFKRLENCHFYLQLRRNFRHYVYLNLSANKDYVGNLCKTTRKGT